MYVDEVQQDDVPDVEDFLDQAYRLKSEILIFLNYWIGN